MRRTAKSEIRESLRQKIERRIPIILAGAGCGIAARAEEEAGADMIMAYNTGIYRMDGHVSLVGYRYYSDGNGDTVSLAGELSGAVKCTPVMAGVCAEDPFRDMECFLEELMALGYSGITNVPSIAGASRKPGSVFGADAQAYGMGAAAEIALIRTCVRKSIYTAMYAYDLHDVRRLAAEGADLLSVHVGGTAGGTTGELGEKVLSLERAAEMTEKCFLAAREENPDIVVVTHGGPFESPEAMEYCFSHALCHGYIGASGIERIPVEQKLEEVYSTYRRLRLF